MKDPWLQQWLPLIRARASALPILELGCGEGEDTLVLVKDGHHVIAIDLSEQSIEAAKIQAPGADYYCQDIRAEFPPNTIGIGVVVASLSLHYFTRSTTLEIVDRICATLQIGGVMLCRLNSTNDRYYGAIGHLEISPNYYLVNGEPKRFFDRMAIAELFTNGWKILVIEEKVIYKYEHPKSVWEVILEREF